MKFRKKPVEIDAIQLKENNIFQVMYFMGTVSPLQSNIEQDKFEDYKNIIKQDGGLLIPTLEGKMKASFGDWIIKGVQGEFYPCKPDIFEQTYEKVTE